MRTTRWTVVALVVPAIAALGIACDQTTPTETLRDSRATTALSSKNGDDDNDGLKAVPFVFVGTAAQCGGAAGTPIVTAAWLGGMGLPDNGGPNAVTNRSNRLGLLLSKNGLTTDCSSSGARIKGVRGMVVDGPTLILGFDVRNGTHCGGGAPRFNVTVKEPKAAPRFFFVGNCATGVQTPATQDPQWTQVRFATVLPAGTRIESISIVYDEGTDQPGAQDPNGVGLSVIDNIFINGRFIRRGKGIADPHGDRGDRDSDSK